MVSNERYEQSLFSRIAEGEEQAFNELYFHLQPSLLGFVIKILKSDEAVMEIIQESLLRFWLQRDKLPEIQSPRKYLFKIVSNECFRYLSQHGIRQQRMKELTSHFGDMSVAVDGELQVSFKETQQIIEDSVRALSPRQQEIYRMSRNHGLRIPEIAKELGLSDIYVKKTLMLALATIRKKLIETGRYTLPVIFWFLK